MQQWRTKENFQRLLTPGLVAGTIVSLLSALAFGAYLIIQIFHITTGKQNLVPLLQLGVALAILAQVLQIMALTTLIIQWFAVEDKHERKVHEVLMLFLSMIPYVPLLLLLVMVALYLWRKTHRIRDLVDQVITTLQEIVGKLANEQKSQHPKGNTPRGAQPMGPGQMASDAAKGVVGGTVAGAVVEQVIGPMTASVIATISTNAIAAIVTTTLIATTVAGGTVVASSVRLPPFTGPWKTTTISPTPTATIPTMFPATLTPTLTPNVPPTATTSVLPSAQASLTPLPPATASQARPPMSTSTPKPTPPYPYTYHLVDLGPFGGTTALLRINNHNQVMYTSVFGGGTCPEHAFLFQNGSIADIGHRTNTCNSIGDGINDSDVMVVDSDHASGSGDYTPHIYNGGSILDIGKLPGDTASRSYAINNAGQVVGYSNCSNTCITHAFYYDGTMHNIGSLGGIRTDALALNDHGQVVGYGTLPGQPAPDLWNPGHAFLYSVSTHAFQDLNALATTSGWDLRQANAINNNGQIVGFGWYHGLIHAFLFTGGQIQDLGILPNGGYSYARACNDHGDAVGGAYGPGNVVLNAVLFTQGHVVNLNSVIDPSLKWDVLDAFSINNNGLIAGWGIVDGQDHSFLLIPA